MIHRTGKHARTIHRDLLDTAIPSQPGSGDSVEERAIKIRRSLQECGAVYSSFALYLSSRVDRLPAEYCRELELTPYTAPSLCPSEIERIVGEELGTALHGLFKEFTFTPSRSALVGQTHEAVLTNGESVTVLLVRPEYTAVKSTQQLAVPLHQKPLRELCHDFATEAVLADFLASLLRATDLRLRGQAIESMLLNDESGGTEPVRRIYRELSGTRVLTFARTEETYLDQILGTVKRDGERVARHLCQRWLRQSLCGRFCPIDPHASNITLAGSWGIDFAGDEFIELPQRTKENILCYLFATLADDPDQAARHLLQEMLSPRRGMDAMNEFRSNFRQACHFGALEPVLGTNTNALTQLIFHHWRTALDHGYTPSPHLLCFYRGLFSIARIARTLAPTEDSLRGGLEELHAIMIVDEFDEIADTSYWSKNADKFVMSVINLPRSIDQALSHYAGSEQDGSPRSMADLASCGREVPVAGAILLVAAIIFIFRSDMNSWIEKSTVLALMLAGLAGLQMWDI